jgi:DNA helicase-2/ATP-dependent DNA helicase PcrA
VKEIIIAGPPGTGKTSKIQEIVRAMLTRRVKADQIALTSFTKTGAIQLAKGSAVHRSGIGTLHSFAFRSLGMEKAQVAESHLDQWNKDNPGWQLSKGVTVDFDDGGAVEITQGATDADEYMAQLGVLRARCTDVEMWPPQVKRFAALWGEWKKANSFFDFADMIDLAVQCDDMPVHYNDNTKKWSGPKVLFGDEFQDFTRAERKLFDHWGKNCEMVLKVGDADQTLYHFKGADPDGMYRPDLPDMQKRVLAQSHRVPVAVHTVAQALVRHIKDRDDVIYHPRPEGGVFRRDFPANFQKPARLIDAIEKDLANDLSVGVMASCGYMLQNIIYAFKQAGLPFCNSYRKNRGDWNILTPGSGVSASQRLLAYLQPMWGPASLEKWASMLESKSALNRGAKTLLDSMADDTQVNFQTLLDLFQPDALANLLGVEQTDLAGMAVMEYDLLKEFVTPDPAKLLQYSLAARKKTLEYPVKIAQVRGAATLAAPIKLEVGTIHSFKGGQFDSIYVVPDLSLKSAREWQARGPGRDAIIRMFYVALTRARIKCTVLNNAQQFYVRL